MAIFSEIYCEICTNLHCKHCTPDAATCIECYNGWYLDTATNDCVEDCQTLGTPAYHNEEDLTCKTTCDPKYGHPLDFKCYDKGACPDSTDVEKTPYYSDPSTFTCITDCLTLT